MSMKNSTQPTHKCHGPVAIMCKHLADNPVQKWHSDYPTECMPLPVAWCEQCDTLHVMKGGSEIRYAADFPAVTLCAGCYESSLDKNLKAVSGDELSAWQSFVDDCVLELNTKQDALLKTYPFFVGGRYEYDETRNRLSFLINDVPRIVCKVELIGSFSTKTNTWLWGWAALHHPVNVRTRIKSVREFGVENKFPFLDAFKWKADEFDAQNMAAVALHVLNAKGFYRMPNKHLTTYLAITEIALAQSDQKAVPSQKSSILESLIAKIRKSAS